jgi:hypothetical protein
MAFTPDEITYDLSRISLTLIRPHKDGQIYFLLGTFIFNIALFSSASSLVTHVSVASDAVERIDKGEATQSLWGTCFEGENGLRTWNQLTAFEKDLNDKSQDMLGYACNSGRKCWLTGRKLRLG